MPQLTPAVSWKPSHAHAFSCPLLAQVSLPSTNIDASLSYCRRRQRRSQRRQLRRCATVLSVEGKSALTFNFLPSQKAPAAKKAAAAGKPKAKVAAKVRSDVIALAGEYFI